MKGKTPYTVFVKGLPKEKKRCKTQRSNCITETARQEGTVRRQPSLYIFLQQRHSRIFRIIFTNGHPLRINHIYQ